MDGKNESIGSATTTTVQIANDRVKHGVFTITPDSSEKWTITSYEGKYAPIPTIILKKSGASPKEIRGYTTQSNTIDVGDIKIQ